MTQAALQAMTANCAGSFSVGGALVDDNGARAISEGSGGRRPEERRHGARGRDARQPRLSAALCLPRVEGLSKIRRAFLEVTRGYAASC